ncbi:P-loop containing nucleoside triphosphate hydrolase protein [Phlegmacium glaucopus]|nr:P-loop containing nucleoside triphosphate hydrolase protein [Phlegmacium glaucopus]
MDLEEFEGSNQIPSVPSDFKSARDVLDYLDQRWFINATRSARWMDLFGDYAGNELFIIDGEAIFQIVLENPLLAIGQKSDCTFQILHAYMILEKILSEFSRRSANFEIVFWNETRHLTIETGGSPNVVAARTAARSLLFAHLLKLEIPVHVFESFHDPSWIRYSSETKPMFIMTNDGGVCQPEPTDERKPTDEPEPTAERILSQRIFILNIACRGTGVALLKGAEYRDSKILSFVYEPKRIADQWLLLGTETLHNKFLHKYRRSGPLLTAANRSTGNANSPTKVFRCLNILSSLKLGVPAEVIYLFIVHCLLLPNLTVQERGHVHQVLPSQLDQIISQNFLPALFHEVAVLLAGCDFQFDMDGTIFIMLIAFCGSQGSSADLSHVVGSVIITQAQAIWCALKGPALDFEAFYARYPIPKDHFSHIQHRKIEPHRLLRFHNPVFDGDMSQISTSTPGNDTDIDLPSSEFGNETIFSDTQHWHGMKTILPSHLGGSKPISKDEYSKRRILRSEQRFMALFQVQAASLTGASGGILEQIVISSLGSRNGRFSKLISRVKKDPEPKLSSKDKLLLKIKEEKEAAQGNGSLAWWKTQLVKLLKLSIPDQVASLKDLLRNPKVLKDRLMALEMRIFRTQLEFQLWLQEPDRDSGTTRDKYTVSIAYMLKEICDANVMTSSAKKVLTAMFRALGFTDFTSPNTPLFSMPEMVPDRPLSFPTIDLVHSKSNHPYHKFMAIVEPPIVWQLRLFGKYMDRSMDGAPDKRVAFQPDAWQRQVLDCIDQDHSLLVVAPTSAGKTFISFYAMEKILRESDDNILVYIAPTKALVTQIAAEVYARFSKTLAGRSCWAIHTRDFRIHEPQKCQILVTVPDMLAIMLLSPPLAKAWTPRIKRIVLDEIHTMGNEDGGAVWEQIILLAPCPIIGLSATIGSPQNFNRWLASVQRAHGYEHTFVEHPYRYSHLRKFYYLIDGRGAFTSLASHQTSQRARFLHPIGLLAFGVRPLPPDLALEAQDTLTLFQALAQFKSVIPHDLSSLEPTTFFSKNSSTFLRQKDVLRYESELKAVLSDLIRDFNPQDKASPLRGVIDALQDPEIIRLDPSHAYAIPSRDALKNDLIVLLADLHKKEELPGLLFSFDRTDCELMAQHITEALKNAEQKWRLSSPEWKQKLIKWETWKAQAKQRERREEKAKKRKQREDDGKGYDIPDASWESSFNPDDPSPQFTFIAPDTSKAQLDVDIEKLSWGSTPHWAFAALRRGVGVHHAGMHRHYRTLVESLFRRGVLRVVIATGTLALGINAPAKTTVFCGDSPYLTALMYRQCAGRAGRRGFDLLGNVIFYGLPIDRVQRIVLSKLPSLGGTFPLTPTLTLRLFNLLDGSQNADYAVKAVKSLMTLPHISFNSDIGRSELLHHLRFSIEYLRQSRLLDKSGRPMNLFALAAHLYYTEPSNLALVALMRNGVFHEVCKQPDVKAAKKDYMLLMCNLFGRRYLSKAFAQEKHIETLQSKYPSMVVLPPLPGAARKVLVQHDAEILRIFEGCALAFATKSAGEMDTDDVLPLSKIRYCGTDVDSSSEFRKYLKNNAIPVTVRSSFVANSGHGDSFADVFELTQTSRSGINLNAHAIPSMTHLTASSSSKHDEHMLNAYLLDFYLHGQVSTLVDANAIRRGDIWYLLQDFSLTLLTVKAALQKLLLNVSNNTPEAEENRDDHEFCDLAEADDHDDDGDVKESTGNKRIVSEFGFDRPARVSDADWRVYEIVGAAANEFSDKFNKMWA